MKNIFITLFISLLISCKVNYSFTGASISPDIKTVSVSFFENRASLASPLISQNFTEALKDIFMSQTNLTLVKNNGDLQFSGYISSYKITPVAIQSNETAALNRLTLSVFVKFINTKDEKQNFQETFTRFVDYDSNLDFSSSEESLLKEVNKQLVQDIFNKAFTNW